MTGWGCLFRKIIGSINCYAGKEGFVLQRLKDHVFYDLGIVCRRDKQFAPTQEGFLELAQAHKDRYSIR